MRRRFAAVLLLSGLMAASGVVLVHAPLAATSGTSGGPSPATSELGTAASLVGSDVLVAPAFIPGPGVRELGEVSGSTPFDVAVGLVPQNTSSLAAYLTALYLPGTPTYHHFLSTSTLAARFGASTGVVAAAATYFRSYGLHVEVSPDRLLLDVQGPASEMGPAFGTTFANYQTGTGRSFVSHPGPAELPPAVATTGVFGLGDATPLEPTVLSSPTLLPVAGPDAACSGGTPFAPCQVWAAYDMNETIADGIDGTGETIAVVDAYDAEETQDGLEADLASFDSHFALPAPTVNYLYPVPSNHDLNTTDTGWELEEALDLQWAHASAPGAAIDMTFSPNPDAGLYSAVDYLVAHQAANVISMSWGEPDTGIFNAFSGPCVMACNASTDGSYSLLDPVLEFAAAEGISVFAASGDCGAADGTSGVSTNFPASDPYVTGVGGTVLSAAANGSWEGETGWSGNESGATSPGCVNEGGSGGGYSPLPRPWWQTGEGLPESEAFRGVPDVSAVASPGVEMFLHGAEVGVAGTSLATPLWAGVAALADQSAHQSLGWLNPALYGVLRGPEYATDFHDIVSGYNGFSAAPGWDPVTGIGSPIVASLLASLEAGPTGLPALTATLNVSSTAGFAPLTVTFSVSASGGTGEYPDEGVAFGDGTATWAENGLVSHTYRTPGVYSAQAYVVDSSGNFSVSLPVALVVGGGSTFTIDLAPSSSAPAVGVPVTLTTTTTGGTAPYSYLYEFGDGTYLNWTANASEVAHTYGASGSFCAEVVVRDSSSPPEGGVSLPVPLAVGGAPAPACEPSPTPLVVSANASVGVRDAPAEYPSLFQVSGGAGTVTEQYQSTDPYVAACQCELFRSPGPESVWLYANESGGPPVVAETNITVAPPLNGTFVVSPTFGPAPLTVSFSASVTGGYDANSALTNWTFGDGHTAVGSSAVETYSTPGIYWAVGRLSDRGHGNASEAFLIDVGPSGPSAAPYLAATVSPAIDVRSGGTVEYSAAAYTWNGTPTGADFAWRLGSQIIGYTADVNRTYFAPAENADAFLAGGNLSVTFLTTGASVTAPFVLAPFFAVEPGGFVPRADALVLTDTHGPPTGAYPLSWEANASSSGPGTVTYAWTFGDGANGSGARVVHTYLAPGKFSAVVTATNSWGDRAVDSAGVEVTNGSAVPLGLLSGPSVESGPPPLTVNFTATASGGSGAPYSYRWEFGDGTNSSLGNVSHTYARVGAYTATITMRDSEGASLTRSYPILVAVPPPAAGPIFGVIPRSFSLALFALTIGFAAGVVLGVVVPRPRRPGRAPD